MLNMEAALGAPGRRWLRWLVILVILVVVAAAALWVAQPLGARTASLVRDAGTVRRGPVDDGHRNSQPQPGQRSHRLPG